MKEKHNMIYLSISNNITQDILIFMNKWNCKNMGKTLNFVLLTPRLFIMTKFTILCYFLLFVTDEMIFIKKMIMYSASDQFSSLSIDKK